MSPHTHPAFAFLLVFGLALSLSAESNGQDWGQFRGPNGTGIAKAENLPTKWSESLNVRWKTEIPGRGWSSPVIADNEIWFTTAIEVKATGSEAQEKMAAARSNGLVPFSSVKLNVVCVDRQSGEIRANSTLFELQDPPLINALNSFASPTPVLDDTHVYVCFGTHGLVCLERASGKIVWSNQNNQVDHETGPGSSPILVDDLLILNCDGVDTQSIVAINKTTGENVWKTARSGALHELPSHRKAFATPTIAELDGQRIVISPGADWVYFYRLETGEEICRFAYGEATGFSHAPVPLVFESSAIVVTGFAKASLIAIDLDAKGVQKDVRWRYKSQVPTMSSPLLIEDKIYMVSNRGIASCVDARTGEKVWHGRLTGNFSSSPILADGKIIFSNREGASFVVSPGDQFKLLSVNELDSDIMGTPAAVGDQLYIRTKKMLYRIESL